MQITKERNYMKIYWHNLFRDAKNGGNVMIMAGVDGIKRLERIVCLNKLAYCNCTYKEKPSKTYLQVVLYF